MPRRQTLENCRRRLYAFERCNAEWVLGGEARRVPLRWRRDASLRRPGLDAGRSSSVPHLRSMVASYAGHLRHGAARTAWSGLWQRFEWLHAIFERHDWGVRERWGEAARARSACAARGYGLLARGAGADVLVFWQNGRFIEFYGPQRKLAERVLGLRSVPLARYGYAWTAGFRVTQIGPFLRRAVSAGAAVVLVPQAPATSVSQPGRLPVAAITPTTCDIETS